MHLLVFHSIFFATHAIAVVQILERSFYIPSTECAFLNNVTLVTNPSIQTCIWACVNEYDCQTAVYFNEVRACSLFSEIYEKGQVVPSGNVGASVICYRKNHNPITLCSTTTASLKEITTHTQITTCTSCSSSCSYGLLFSLDQSNVSSWGTGGTGYTTYTITWHASSATSATIQFQYHVTSCSFYWGLDSVSVMNVSGIEHITNGGFSSKSSWNETCGMSSCGSTSNYGPNSSSVLVIRCCSPPYYYSVSQTFPTVPYATYNISFIMASYNTGSSTNTNVYVYVY